MRDGCGQHSRRVETRPLDSTRGARPKQWLAQLGQRGHSGVSARLPAHCDHISATGKHQGRVRATIERQHAWHAEALHGMHARSADARPASAKCGRTRWSACLRRRSVTHGGTPHKRRQSAACALRPHGHAHCLCRDASAFGVLALAQDAVSSRTRNLTQQRKREADNRERAAAKYQG